MGTVKGLLWSVVAVVVLTCVSGLLGVLPAILGIGLGIVLAVLAGTGRFAWGMGVAVVGAVCAAVVFESTIMTVWLSLIAVVFAAVVVVGWSAMVRPGPVGDVAWWSKQPRYRRQDLRGLVKEWPDTMYHVGLTTVDSRRHGLGIWARSRRARDSERMGEIAAGDEGRRHTPKLERLGGTNVGFLLTINPAPGQSEEDWRAKRDHLAKMWGVLETRIVPVAPGRIGVHVVMWEGLSETLDYPEPFTSEVSIKSLPFGVDEEGEEVSVRLYGSNVLLGGQPEAGKSGGQSAIIAGAAQCENVALLGLDPKRVELASWRPRFTEIATNEDDSTDLLRRLVDEMERRYDLMELEGVKKVETFSPEMPFVVLVVDELAELLAAGVTSEEKKADEVRQTLLRRIVSKGRAAGIATSDATQKPDAKTVPTGIRDLIAQRLGYRTGNGAMTEVIMGSGRGDDVLCDEIDPDQQGVCYALLPGSTKPRKVRTLWLADERVSDYAEATAHLKPDWSLVGDVEDAEVTHE